MVSGDDFERLVHDAGAVSAVDAEAVEFLDLVAEADAQIEASVGEDVDGGGVLGDADRVVEGEEEDPGADADSGGESGDGGGDGQDGGGCSRRR